MSKELSGRHSARLLFDIFLIIVALVFFFNSLDLDFRPWLFPGSFSLILLIMATIQTLMDWKQARKTSGIAEPAIAEAREEAPREEKKVAVEGQYARLGIAVLSMLGFYIIFRFATIYLAIPVLCVLLVRFLGGRSWLTTGILALGMDAFVYVCFQWLLQTSL
jgi:hypothetical protein